MNRILVTGASGFLGPHVVERLLARGAASVRCFLRPGSDRGRVEALATRFPDAYVEPFVGSLSTEKGAAQAIEGVSTVYHLAAALGGAAADMFLSTVVASKNLLEAVAHAGRPIKVVLVSSFGVYGVGDLPRGSLVDENTQLEPHPERRDLYSQTKLRQEKLFWEYHKKHGIPLVVLRPGVIYGPRGSALSARVGLDLAGVFLSLGGKNVLPLSYVENCADAIVLAGSDGGAVGQVYNVHDDDLPTCDGYLAAYEKRVKKLRRVRVPYAAMQGLSSLVQRYHAYSKGQLPAVFTPYKTATTWKGNRFDNRKLKSLGWKQLVPTDEGMRRTFEHLRAERA
jgi:nucleoside-diphosphate-sugar epimerase